VKIDRKPTQKLSLQLSGEEFQEYKVKCEETSAQGLLLNNWCHVQEKGDQTFH